MWLRMTARMPHLQHVQSNETEPFHISYKLTRLSNSIVLRPEINGKNIVSQCEVLTFIHDFDIYRITFSILYLLHLDRDPSIIEFQMYKPHRN